MEGDPMTTIFAKRVTCAVCGATQTVQEMGSTSSFGAMDLDTRPPPLRRSTMSLWVHECGECGYVAPELGEAVEGAARVVASAEYRAELKCAGRAPLANRMVCRSLLEAAAGEFVTAGWRRLHAAWACDDAGAVEEARVQRLAALGLFEQAQAKGQRAMKSVEGGDEVLLADIARRAAEFENAMQYCDAGLAAAEVPEFVRAILEYERTLVLARDTACHNVGEVAETADEAQGTVH
jgi:hypothetical protein